MVPNPLALEIELTSSTPAGRVVVTNRSDAPTAVWNLDNAWGDGALSFEIRHEAITAVVRAPQVYTRNVPSSVVLAGGESHAWDFDLGDGSWDRGLDSARGPGARLVAVYETVASEEAELAGVWIGRVESEPVELTG